MESEAKYAVVGAFVFAVAAAVVIFAIWLGKYGLDRKFLEYEVVFKGPVRGLSQSGEVRFNGIKVGEVSDLRLDTVNPNIVLARIRIFAETPIKEDSYAQLEPQGITGLSYIQIYGGALQSKKLEIGDGREYAQIPTKQAQLEGLVAGGEDVLLAANTALVKANAVMSTKNIAKFSETLKNIQIITAQFAAQPDLAKDIGQTVRGIGLAAQELELAAAEMKKFGEIGVGILEKDTVDMIAQIDAASNELRLTSQRANQLLENISGPVSQFSQEGLGELTRTLGDLRAVLQAVERVVEEVDRNPMEFIGGEPLSEVEVPR